MLAFASLKTRQNRTYITQRSLHTIDEYISFDLMTWFELSPILLSNQWEFWFERWFFFLLHIIKKNLWWKWHQETMIIWNDEMPCFIWNNNLNDDMKNRERVGGGQRRRSRIFFYANIVHLLQRQCDELKIVINVDNYVWNPD